MRCLRCGRESENLQEFCGTCLQSMELYPVNPDTLIQLPRHRTEETGKKQSAKKRMLSTEEQLEQLKKLQRWLITGSVLLLVLLGLVTALLVKELQETDVPQRPMGRNYTVTAEQTD